MAGSEPGLCKRVVLSVELGDTVLYWHLLWLPPKASAVENSVLKQVRGRRGPQCWSLWSPFCVAQTSVSGMLSREKELACLTEAFSAEADTPMPRPLPVPASSLPSSPALLSCASQLRRHCGRRPPANSALSVRPAWDLCPRPVPPRPRMHVT